MCSCTHRSQTTTPHSFQIRKSCDFPFNKICIYIAAFVVCFMLSSQGLVLATAMAVSAGTIILFDFFKEKCLSNIRQNQDCPPPEKKALKSCLASDSGSTKSDQAKKKKKKNRVKFAEDVKDSGKKINGELYRKEQRKFGEIRKSCGNEIQKMPANHVALYSGILKDRVHRMQYSY